MKKMVTIARGAEMSPLIPLEVYCGFVDDGRGNNLEFWMEYTELGAVFLDTIWHKLDNPVQAQIVEAVADAMPLFQQITLDEDYVQYFLCGTPFDDGSPKVYLDPKMKVGLLHATLNYRTRQFFVSGKSCIEGKVKPLLGGPRLGHFEDMAVFLAGIIDDINADMKTETSFLKLAPDGDGVMVKFLNTDEELQNLHFTARELDTLQNRVVLCHNAIDPSNILVKIDENKKIKLVGITNWQYAGFYHLIYDRRRAWYESLGEYMERFISKFMTVEGITMWKFVEAMVGMHKSEKRVLRELERERELGSDSEDILLEKERFEESETRNGSESVGRKGISKRKREVGSNYQERAFERKKHQEIETGKVYIIICDDDDDAVDESDDGRRCAVGLKAK
ncbi:hypothetical protein G7Y89_g4222 [Cudoniella acicularis]|uniref:Aminoglycoside phosphotransferase domain-containing protein n=1 Tax=Cudoniella acicularis TaxID=354080 RepID=A0A8H4RRU6_9HELO|nr:hypothetical protein G7Y89_g4222 [Cudoniella acicularis]